MAFHLHQRVAYPAFGLGRIASLERKAFLDAELTEFYEVVGERGTVWVQVSEAASRGLRRLTHQTELPRYRDLLRQRPQALDPDNRLRHLATLARFKRGTLQDICEIVRDLAAFRWQQPLGEYDVVDLNKGRRWLCQEWAAADGVPLAEAETEIAALLHETRLACG